ncbi:MAG: T9SS type A sorting domain-containing protein [Cytophagales bacterium]
MRKIQLLLVALTLLTLSNSLLFAQTVTPATAIQLCPDNNYTDLDTIKIIESLPADFLAGESGVTYSLILPAGFQFEPFTGNVFLSDSFSSGTFTVFPDSVFITYSINLGSLTGTDSIIISGLRVRTSTAGLPSADIDRGGTATHASNGPGVNSHGSLSSGQALTGISLTSTNITCNGDGDGTITVNITSGNAPYDYSIDFGSSYPYSASPITSLAGGGYIVTVRDNLGCVANSSNVAIINEPSVISELSVSKTDMSCNGVSDGTITAAASGGTGTINYSISGVAGPFDSLSGVTTTGLGAGIYDIYFEDANGCQLDGSDVTIIEPSVISPAANVKTDISCNGLTDGSITANASGGTGQITYSINGIAGPFNTNEGITINNLSAAAYDIYFQDANGCQLDGADETVNEPSLITESSAIRTNVVCNGANDGTITATAAGGTGAINYSVNGIAGPYATLSGATITNLSPGAYSVYYEDANGCRVPGSSLSITEPNPIVESNVTKTDISCNNANDGTITASASGGTAPISFSVNGAGGPFTFASGATASSLTPGNKDVYFRDASGCTLDGTDQNISNPAAISISAPTSSDPTTAGGIDGQIIFGAVSGGIPPYDYSIDGGTIYQSNGTFNNLGSGNYNLQVRDANNCVQVYGPLTLNDPGNISPGGISFAPNTFDTTLCNGEPNPITIQSDSAASGGGVNYQWQISTNGVSWTDISGATSTSYTILGPHTTQRFYRRETTKGGDVAFSNSVQRKINNGNTINITVPSPLVCVEGNNQIISASPAPSGAQTGVFSISPGSGLTDNGNGTASFNPGVAGVNSHTITYDFTNEFGCQSTNNANVDVVQNSSVTISLPQTNYVTTDPPATITGTPSGGTYSGPGVVGSQFRPNIADTGLNRLYYQQADVNGCVGIDSIDINVSVPGGSISGLNSPYCTDDPISTITGVPTGPGTTPIGFVGSPILTNYTPTTADLDPNVTPNTYLIQYRYFDQFFSIITVSASVTVNPKPTATLITGGSTTFCFDDPVRVLGGAPGSGDFIGTGISNDIGTSADFTASVANVGNHLISFIYTDGNGCDDTASAVFTVNPIPNPSMSFAQAGNYCSNDPTDLITGSPIPNGTTTFGTFSGSGLSNNNGNGTVNFTPGIPTLGSQTFTYSYTNSFGCTNSVDSAKVVSLVPTATLSGLDVDYCENSLNDTLSGAGSTFGTGYFQGVGLANASIDSISGILSVSTLIPNTADTFFYVFTDTIGCTDTAFGTTTINALPVVSVTVLDDSLCIDGNSIDVFGSPPPIGLDQTLFKGVQSQIGAQAIFSPSSAGVGTHTVTYIFTKFHPGNSCRDSASIDITVNPLPQVGYVFTDQFTGDTINDLRFCGNEDSILLMANQIAGVYTTSNSNITNIGGGQAYMSPKQTISQFSSGLKQILYGFTHPVTGCYNDTALTFEVNKIPNNFGIAGNPSSAFTLDPPSLNKFCTEDDTVDLFRFYKPIPGNTGTGLFKILPDPGSSTGGLIGNPTSDSVKFLSALPSGNDYELRYVFTDTVTGCIDSVSKLVEIEAEPFLGVRVFNSILTQPNINNLNNDTIPICVNGDSLYFIGLNDTALSEVNFNESIFTDVTDVGAIGISINTNGDSVYTFYPKNTNITGFHTLQFDYTSNTGCQDVFTFIVEVLDTPNLDLLIDTTFLTVTGNDPEICKSVDTLIVTPISNMIGFGSVKVSNTSLPIEAFSNTVNGQPNDTLIYFKPNEISQSIVNPINYIIEYSFTETESGPRCSSKISQSLIVNPLPRLTNNSFNPSPRYCEYDTIDLIFGLGGITLFDSGYFSGPGILNFANDSATFNPQAITAAFTDQGTTDSIKYTVLNGYGCIDSLSKAVTVYPKPDIEFTIQDTVNSLSTFCRSDPSNYIIIEDQPNGNLAGNTFRRIPNGQNPIGNVFTPLQPVGPLTLYIDFVTQFGGCVDTDSQDIYIYADPSAGFMVNEFCITDPINFIDTSLNNNTPGNPADSIISWEWVLAPNEFSNVQNPTFDYTSKGQGSYNIELKVTNTIGCEDDTDRDIFFGAPPIAKFNVNDICEDIDILFSNNSDNTDSVGSGDFKWRLSQFPFDPNNLIDTFINSGSFNYQFSDPGAYAMQLDLASSYGCSDDTILRLDIRPVIDLSNGTIYTSDFDNDSIEWRPATLSSGYSWEQAVPNSTKINTGPNGSNQQVWITNASGSYNSVEKSYVEGPCFDFSRVRRPMIIFDYFSDLAVNDGVVLQYSKNRGQNWRTIGLEETGLNWYNESSIAGNPGNQALGQVGWSIQDSVWREARHQLDTLRNNPPLGSNNPFVRLRLAFGSSNANVGSREGFAFGNVRIQERDKLTLIEHFTNINDQNARQGDKDHNELINTLRNKYDILDIQYHTDFPGQDPVNLDNSLEQGARSLFYGVSTIPRTVFEGNVFNNVTSTWVSNANILDDGKQKFVAQRILKDAKFDIDLSVTKTNNNLNGTVTFTAKQNLVQGREYTAFIAVVEKFIPVNSFSGSNQIPQGVEFRSVFKKFLPQASGTNINTINVLGDSRSINFNWNYNNVYNFDSIYVVAFIQDNVTREIYQVASDDTTNIWVPNSIDNQQTSNTFNFKLYPNPNKGTSILEFEAPAEGEEVLTIYNQMGYKVFEEEIYSGTRSVLLDLKDQASGVYIVQIAHPKYGITKSRMVITR